MNSTVATVLSLKGGIEKEKEKVGENHWIEERERKKRRQENVQKKWIIEWETTKFVTENPFNKKKSSKLSVQTNIS